jgi:hypothetical protein
VCFACIHDLILSPEAAWILYDRAFPASKPQVSALRLHPLWRDADLPIRPSQAVRALFCFHSDDTRRENVVF